MSDGGAAIVSYIIEKRDSGAYSSWSRVDKVRSHCYEYTITNLKQGEFYSFRIIAENAQGRSKPLETSAPVQAKSPFTVPNVPANLRVVGLTEDSITVEWTAPRGDGGRPVTGYVIERLEFHERSWSYITTVSSTSNRYKLTYLEPNMSYFIRVAAENEEGVSDWRETRDAIKPSRPTSLPSAPGLFHVDHIT